MRDLVPCDLGDGIEVIHDVELIEVEMECDVEDEAAYYESIEIDHGPDAAVPVIAALERMAALGFDASAVVRSPVWDTLPFSPFETAELATGSGPVVSESAQTVPFVRVESETVPYPMYSAPYERVEITRESDPRRAAWLRAPRRR